MNKTKFKQTEIGMIPEDWDAIKGEDCLILEIGSRPKGGVSDVGEIPSLGGEHIDLVSHRIDFQKSPKYISREYFNQMQKGKLKINDILINKDGAYTGKLAFVWELFFPETVINEHLFIIRSSNQLDQKFIFYYFLSNEGEHQIKQNVTGSAQAGLNSQFIKRIMLPKPSLSEQIQISEILSRLDLKINIIQKQNKTLEAIGQAIFKQWFVDFEFPNEEGEHYKSSGGEMVYNEELEKEIPKGWRVGKLGDNGIFKNGINYLRGETGDTEFFIANVRDIANNKLLLKESLDKIKVDFKKVKDYLLNDKDILIARSASPGEISLVLGNLEKVIYSGFSIRYRLKNPNNYLYFFLILQGLKENLLNFSVGTTLQSVNQETLKNMKFIFPLNDILKEFNKIIGQILDKTYNNLIQNSSLSQIRDSLLPKLVSGKIRVPLEVK